MRRYRKICNLKQIEVARRMGLENSSLISRWETGFSLPDLENAFSLAAIYHVTVDELFHHLGADSRRGRVKMYEETKTKDSRTD